MKKKKDEVELVKGGVIGLPVSTSSRHSKQHMEAGLKLIWDMCRRNPSLGLAELWYHLKKRGYPLH